MQHYQTQRAFFLLIYGDIKCTVLLRMGEYVMVSHCVKKRRENSDFKQLQKG